MKFIQVNCREGNKADYRQGRMVLKLKPDIIIFEYPEKNGKPDSTFNKFPVSKKPFKDIDEIKKNLKKASEEYPYALSDILVWENIEKLWKSGKNVQLFNIDAPAKIRAKAARNKWLMPQSVNKLKKIPEWNDYIKEREKIMAKNMKHILKKYKNKDVLAAVFVQSFHWDNLKKIIPEIKN